MDAYDRIKSASREEFDELRRKKNLDEGRFTTSTENDLRSIENLLDLQRGVLDGKIFRIESAACSSCGHQKTPYDFFSSALKDAGHSSSFLVHVIFGRKLVINEPRPIRCSVCGFLDQNSPEDYGWDNYECVFLVPQAE
jgi:hypothetical protein